MEETYDTIVLGTGMKECILSALMSQQGKRVLHLDRNDHYGGESASLSLEQLYERFAPGQKPPTEFGRSRDYCVDLCPKFIMACGDLVKVLLTTKVTRYLQFKAVAGAYVVADRKVLKVPATPTEALSSNLMGIFQKRRFKNFLQWVQNYEQQDHKTHEGFDVTRHTAHEMYEYWKLDEQTQQFTGHAIALQESDSYLKQSAAPIVEALKLYAYSLSRYGSSPYIYPLYGLGGLPEGFSRLSAIHGGTYMLNHPISEILYDENGRVRGIRDMEGKEAYCKQLITDPSYVASDAGKVRSIGKIVRSICLLSHPIENTNNSDSCQIIIPYHQIRNRHSDIYVFCVSYVHQVVPQNKWLAVISTNVETDNPNNEIQPALSLLGKVDAQFTWVSENYQPINDGATSQVFVTSSYDSTSHFESATVEVIRLYEKITGNALDLSITAEPDELEG